MEKQIINKQIFRKDYQGIIFGIDVNDLPTFILPGDIINIEKREAFYSENNSWDDHSILTVHRPTPETDEEFELREKRVEQVKKESKQRKFVQYQALKLEFEKEENSILFNPELRLFKSSYFYSQENSIEDEIYLVLEEMDVDTAGKVNKFLNNIYPNLTVCPYCHVDDFVHTENCKLGKRWNVKD